MNEKDIQEFKMYICKDLAKKHRLSEEKASDIVQRSAINRLLQTSPELVMHYPVKSWANDLWKEHRGVPVG